MKDISFAFDIGHASIGWAAVRETSTHPEFLGCGTVIFRRDDCQNHARAAFRRSRRNIAATRNRMKRLGKLMLHLGVFTGEELADRMAQGAGHPFPWLLAANVLTGTRDQLSWLELWDVLRWYAHNRGYDGNALWSAHKSEEESKDDTEKEANAHRLMDKYSTGTMAETLCAFLDVDPKYTGNSPLKLNAEGKTPYFKGENAAFGREVVRDEVIRILRAHQGKLNGCDVALISCLCGKEHDAWKAIPCPAIRLPQRFHGGLLFGQMVPRFDNRIIPVCRISGEKTPDKHCREFYRYRWGMLLCNMTVRTVDGDTRKLTASERRTIHTAMEQNGYLNKTTLKKALASATADEPANLDMLFLTPEMERALVFDPVKRLIATDTLKPVWPTLPEKWQKVCAGRLYKGRTCTLQSWREKLNDDGNDMAAFDDALDKAYAAYKKRRKKKAKDKALFQSDLLTIDSYRPSGRAPYSCKLMQQAWDAVFDDDQPDPKDKSGCLEETQEVVDKQLQRSIDEQTNNSLVRHRLLIFRRLLKQLIKNYGGGQIANVKHITLEVIRDLQEFSAKTAKEKAQLMGLKLADHKKAVRIIDAELTKYNGQYAIGAGLIKKVRIANDTDWLCPFTGKKYCFDDIVTGKVDREHIIPRSWRPSDALGSLVLTWPEVNRMKGQRTAHAFIEQDQGKPVPGRPELRIMPVANYEKLVKGLKPKSDPRSNKQAVFIDDDLRRWRRKLLLQLPTYDKYNRKDSEDGQSTFLERDLTQTSHINKLAAMQARDELREVADDGSTQNLPQVIMLAGSVTAAVRRAWQLEGCLAQVCPETVGKTKTDVRDITHLHHALDAATMALAAFYFPRNGRLWEIMSRRSIKHKADQEQFKKLARQGSVKFGTDGKWTIADLPEPILERLSECLTERRVVMHQPKTMRGLKVQQNTWRVLHQDPKDEHKMVVTMRERNDEGTRIAKLKTEKKSKLHGLAPKDGKGKLKALQGSLIIDKNYCVILEPEPVIVTHRNIWHTVSAIIKELGQMPRMLNAGDWVKINSGNHQGIWQVRGIDDNSRDGILLKLASPHMVKNTDDLGRRKELRLLSLLKQGLELMPVDYTGH